MLIDTLISAFDYIDSGRLDPWLFYSESYVTSSAIRSGGRRDGNRLRTCLVFDYVFRAEMRLNPAESRKCSSSPLRQGIWASSRLGRNGAE